MSRSTASSATYVTWVFSPVPGDWGSTVAPLTIWPLAVGRSSPVTWIGGMAPSTGRIDDVEQDTRWPLMSQVQPSPVAIVGRMAAGMSSTTVAPRASEGPVLATVRM